MSPAYDATTIVRRLRSIADRATTSHLDAGCLRVAAATVEEAHAYVALLKRDRLDLARLAAASPQFDNPLEVHRVQALRDRLLVQEAGRAVVEGAT